LHLKVFLAADRRLLTMKSVWKVGLRLRRWHLDIVKTKLKRVGRSRGAYDERVRIQMIGGGQIGVAGGIDLIRLAIRMSLRLISAGMKMILILVR
jgi:hypothetical protein